MIALNQHVFGFVNFLIKNLKESIDSLSFKILAECIAVLHDVIFSFHSKRGKNDCDGTNITTPVFQLSEPVDVPSIRSPASHGAKNRPGVIRVISLIATPIHVCVVWI